MSFMKKKVFFFKENKNCFEIFKDYFIFKMDSSKIITCVEIAPILQYYHNIKVWH